MNVRPFASVVVVVGREVTAPKGDTVQLTDWPATGDPDAVSTSTPSEVARGWPAVADWLSPCLAWIDAGCAAVTSIFMFWLFQKPTGLNGSACVTPPAPTRT